MNKDILLEPLGAGKEHTLLMSTVNINVLNFEPKG